MDARYQKTVFDEWGLIAIGEGKGRLLDYLGPRNAAGQPLGGEALMEGSIEARISIYKEFRAVTFLDFRNVFLKIPNLDLGQLKYSAGFGLRVLRRDGEPPLGVERQLGGAAKQTRRPRRVAARSIHPLPLSQNRPPCR